MAVDNSVAAQFTSAPETPTVSPVAMTPLAFLARSAAVFPDRVAVIDRERRLTYRQFAEHAEEVARALISAGVEPGRDEHEAFAGRDSLRPAALG
jgi:non-ribosomal peptide synthetase component F